MLRVLAAAAVLAGPAAAQEGTIRDLFFDTGPKVAINGAVRAALGQSCDETVRVKMDFTFDDPQGVAYASVTMAADDVQPVLSGRAETYLWVPDYARPLREYRWRIEDLDAGRRQRTIAVLLDVPAGAGPIHVELLGKDGTGELMESELLLLPAICG